jgi:transcriptional regulator with XRE-family HTH domain
MSKKAAIIMPDTRAILMRMGEQITLARLRRKLSCELIAERAGISRQTLNSIEKGSSTVSMGSYAAVLHALNNLDSDLLLVAKEDEFGRKLQDLGLSTRKRAPKRVGGNVSK